jgi:hypothetical protein
MDDERDLSVRIALEMVRRALMEVEVIDGCVQEAHAESEILMWRGRELTVKINQARGYLEAARLELEKEIAGDTEFEAAVASIRRTLESERSTEPTT